MELLKIAGYLLALAALFVNMFWSLKTATLPSQKKAITISVILQIISLVIFIAVNHRWLA